VQADSGRLHRALDGGLESHAPISATCKPEFKYLMCKDFLIAECG
jgi:hypothetical protein